MANKVQFGLKNAYFAVATETFNAETGKWTTTYGNPIGIPGSVNIQLSKESATSTFKADNMNYFTTSKTTGYNGSYELAKVPASVLVDVFGMKRDSKNLLVESTDDDVKTVAMMFEIDGDVKPTRYCLPRVNLATPDIESSTIGDDIEVNTETLNLTVLPRLDDSIISIRADEETDEATYNSFYTAVPTVTPAS